MTDPKLMVCIISNEKKLEDVLEALLEADISRASIIDVRGMLEYLADEIPLFAGFRSLIEDNSKTNKMIISVVENKEKLEHAFDTIEQVYGSFSETNTGIMFALDVAVVRGIKS